MKDVKLTRRQFLISTGTFIAGSILSACTSDLITTTQPEATTAPSAGSTSKEAPMLAALVAEGKLPPLEDRIPKEPLVITPLEGVLGKYGGTLEELVPEAYTFTSGTWIGPSYLGLATDLKTIYPAILKSYELSEDQKTVTCHLREGMKWSDGEPLTSEDVQFWYEDVVRNEDITPGGDLKLKPGGEWMTLVIVDEFTFQMVFSIPYPRIIEMLSSYGPMPKHYLKQWHITYNEDANALAKSENYEFWHQAFKYHRDGPSNMSDPNLPSLLAWIEESRDANGNQILKRNPYFCEVDTEGNQLPYADYMKKTVTGSTQLITTRFLAGEGTHNGYYTSLSEYPLYDMNEEKGNYTTYLFRDNKASQMGYVFNYCHKDDFLREMFNDVRFRKAMSLAINRDELNSLYYASMAVSRHPYFDPDASFYEEGLDTNCIEYDLDQANALLDDMGLEWDADHVFRLRTDGKPIHLEQDLWYERNHPEMAELIRGYWKACGIDITVTQRDIAYMHRVIGGGDQDITAWNAAGASEWFARKYEILWIRPPWNWQWFPTGGTCWFKWLQSDGAEGTEPPEIVKELWSVVDEWIVTARGTDRYNELGRKIMQINNDNLWAIGTIGLAPRAVLLRNTLRNVPRGDVTLSTDYSEWGLYHPEQWVVEA